jgi:hypothetical protein
VYTFNRGSFRSPSLARVGERSKQDLDAFGRFRLAERGMQLRKRRVSQDLDRGLLLRGLRGDPVGLGVHAQLPHEGGRLHPFRGLVFEGR